MHIYARIIKLLSVLLKLAQTLLNVNFRFLDIMLLDIQNINMPKDKERKISEAGNNHSYISNDEGNGNLNAPYNEACQIWIYDTNKYQAFKQFTRFINEFSPEDLEYLGETAIDGINYMRYGNEDITLQVISMDSYSDSNSGGPVEYTVTYRYKTFTFKEDVPDYPENLKVYYADINKDKIKDLVIKGAPHFPITSGLAIMPICLQIATAIYIMKFGRLPVYA